MKRNFLSIVFCVLFSTNLFAQNNILTELIDLPAPPPVQKTDEEKRPAGFYDDKNPPADDAPIEDLLNYWQKKANVLSWGDKNLPSATTAVALRLIQVIDDAPSKFNGFLKILPKDAETLQRIKLLYETKQTTTDVSDSWRDDIKKWLKFNSDFYVGELFDEARQAKDNPKHSSVNKEEELKSLARFDWEKARTILEKLESDSANPNAATLAKRLLYEHAIAEKDENAAEKYRVALKSLVEDKTSLPSVRDAAMDALAATDWQGRDDWYLSLLGDETLLAPTDDGRLYSPLTTITEKEPDKWIPVLTKLVGNKNRSIHNAVVQSLIQFKDRKDALEPLLPWLTDSNWADAHWSGSDRTAYMQIVADVDLPESVPGLMWIVENDADEAHWAARSLESYKDARAIPALRNALGKYGNEDTRQAIIAALVACGGLSGEEQMSALESYAEFVSVPANLEALQKRGEYEDENPLAVAVSVGAFLAKQKEPGEDLIRLLIGRLKILQKEKPAVAKILSGLMSNWKGRLLDLEMLDRIGEGAADTATIVGALARRKELKENLSNEIYALRGKKGLTSGIAACLTDDETEVAAAFRSDEKETMTATLACARLLRKPLPVAEVGTLLKNPDTLLALAAERYLEAEDSRRARNLVLSVHPNEALILGARTSFNPAKMTINVDYQNQEANGLAVSLQNLFSSVSRSYLYPNNYYDFDRRYDKFEANLRKTLLEDKNLKEIYATNGNVLKIYQNNRAVLTWENDVTFDLNGGAARYREKTLTKDELEMFYNDVSENNLDERQPILNCSGELCGGGEFVILNRSGGRRIFSYGNMGSGLWMSAFFSDLQTEDAALHYKFEKYVKGLEILLADQRFQPKTIWKNGDDFRVLVADEERKTQIEEEISKLDKIDDANEEMDYQERGIRARKRRSEREFEHYEWREFKAGKLGGKVEEPTEVPFLRDNLTFPSVENLSDNESIWQAKWGNYVVRVGDNFDSHGLWKTNRSETTKIADGWFGGEVIVSGNWAIAAKTDDNWSVPNYVVRVNLQTGKQIKINLPPADDFEPVALVPGQDKILLRRAADENTELKKNNPSPAAPEYYLLDAKTGKTESVKGEFQPLRTQTFRALQSTGKQGEFWATVYDREKNVTDIGVYDAKNFSFKSILKLPEIRLDSMKIRVAAAESKVYFVYEDNFGSESHLLSVPLTEK